jgi:ATP-dependent helicase/DNAse subunit B
MSQATNRLFLVPFGCPGTTRNLFRAALSGIAGPDYSGITYIAPTPRKVRAALADFLAVAGRDACIPPTFATLGQYARRTWAETGSARRLSPEQRALLLMRLLPNAGPGFARAVSDFIKTLREYRPDLSPARLAAELGRLLAGYDQPRARALEAVAAMERYLNLLDEKGWQDEESIQTHVASDCPRSSASACGSAHLGRPGCLVLDGFYDLTRLQERVLAGLVESSSRLVALAYADPAEPAAYEIVQGFRSFLHRVRPGLVEEQLALDRPARVNPEFLQFHSREDEVEGIARDLKARLLRHELEPDQAIVVFPDFANYAAIVRRVFARFGIPCTIYPEPVMAGSPPVQAVLQLLDSLQNDYPRIPFVSVLTSPYFSRISATCRRHANRLSLAGRIVKGTRAWLSLKSVLLRERPADDNADTATIAEVQKEVRSIVSLCEELRREPRATLSSYAHALKKLLAELAFGPFPGTLEPLNPGALAADRDAVQARRSLYELLESIVSLEQSFGTATCTLSEFCRTLVSLLSGVTAAPESAPSGVLVCSTLETRGLDCTHLYYGGLIEGELPSRFKHDAILPDWIREKLGLPHVDRHNQWQRLHFFRLVNTPAQPPFLTCPDAEDNTLLLPSPFLDRDPAVPPDDPTIYTEEARQRHAGRKGGERLEGRCQAARLEPGPDVIAELGRRFAPERAVSVTSLERYLACPFAFYLEQVLGLAARPEPTFALEPADWGTILHRILELLYARGDVPVPEIAERLRTTLPAALEEFDLPVFWRRAVTRVFARIQPELLELEAGLRRDGYRPVASERRVSGEVVPGLRARGRVDRIEEGPDGLRVLDYKTGQVNITANAVLKYRTHIQLPLYAHLLRDKYPGRPVTDVGMFGLRDMKVQWLSKGKVPMSELLGAALETSAQAIAAIRRAEFPASGSACRYCDYTSVCPAPREQAQVQAGSPGSLSPGLAGEPDA